MTIRSAIFNALFWVATFIIGGTGTFLSLIHRPWAFSVARAWMHTIFLLLRVLCGITYEVRGKEYIPQGAALVASKHQSAWDTVVFWALIKKPVFVLKRELIYIPVFGWMLLLLKSIYIDRSSGAKALKHMLRMAQNRITENCAIVIFPEGTRTVVGTNSTYHPGVAALYQNLKLPVVPVALNSGLFWGRNSFLKTPGVITIEFLPPIPAGMKGRDFLPLLQERIETATAALVTSPAVRP